MLVVPQLGGLNATTTQHTVAFFHVPALASLAAYCAIAMTFNTLVMLPSAAGEEIGWRGLLVPAFATAYGERRAALFSGIVWALWHWPLVWFGIFQGRNPVWFSVVAVTLVALFAGIVFAWLRLRSGSVWSTVVAHAAHNAIIQTYFDRLIAPTPLNGYLAGELGLFLAVVLGCCAWWCWYRLNPQVPPECRVDRD